VKKGFYTAGDLISWRRRDGPAAPMNNGKRLRIMNCEEVAASPM